MYNLRIGSGRLQNHFPAFVIDPWPSPAHIIKWPRHRTTAVAHTRTSCRECPFGNQLEKGSFTQSLRVLYNDLIIVSTQKL